MLLKVATSAGWVWYEEDKSLFLPCVSKAVPALHPSACLLKFLDFLGAECWCGGGSEC